MHTERTYRQLHPDAQLSDGIARARRRNYYRPMQADCYGLRVYLLWIAGTALWALFCGWLVNR